MELHLPLDFESLPEYRLLVMEMGAEAARQHRPTKDEDPALHRLATAPTLNPMAVFVRLFVDLGHEAGRLGRAGYLGPSGLKLFTAAAGAGALPPLLASGLVVEQDGGIFCERFARHNAHLSPNHKSKERLGAEHSSLVRNKRNIAAEANAQSMLFAPDFYKDRAGGPIVGVRVQRVLVLIRTMDNALGIKERNRSQYTEGLIADADHALTWLEANLPEEKARYRLFHWIQDHVEEAALPKTTEQLLGHWEEFIGLWEGNRRRET